MQPVGVNPLMCATFGSNVDLNENVQPTVILWKRSGFHISIATARYRCALTESRSKQRL